MRGRIFYFGILLLICLSSQTQSQVSSFWDSDTSIYFYSSDSNAENLIATKVVFANELTKEEILDSIASYLSGTYFIPKHNKYYEDKQRIIISIMDINAIDLPDRKYSIATVDIYDPDKICMTTFFQGSTGGHQTFLILVSNLMQPQLKYPLLDGLIIFYNDKELKAMDHINLEGIISEREIDNIVRKSIKN